jgi:ketosteroid isomerase-like protein
MFLGRMGARAAQATERAGRAVSEEAATPDLEERVRRAIEAYNRRDYDEVMTLYAPDVVWDGSPFLGAVFEGREVVRGFFEDWAGAYENFAQELEEFRHLGHGVTFGVLFQRGRLPGSSEMVTFRYAAVVTWVDSLIERVTSYTDVNEARAAAERLAEERGG